MVSLNSRRPEIRFPWLKGESQLRDIVEGIPGALHSLNILLLQQGVDGLKRSSGVTQADTQASHKPF